MLREAADYLVCPQGSGRNPVLGVLQYWPNRRPVGLDIVIANCIDTTKTPSQHLRAREDAKKNVTGSLDALKAARTTHAQAKRELAVARAAGARGADLDKAVKCEQNAAMAVANAYSPGFEEAAARANTTFFAHSMTPMGGYGPGALAAIRAIAHPGDGLLIGEGGPRFEAEDVVFNTRLHHHYLTSAIAVAFWNASHEAAAEVAQNLPGRPWRTGLQGAG